MSEKEPDTTKVVNPIRLRIGVLLILLWWIPFWAMSPYISQALGYSSDSHATAVITTIIMIVQTVVGFIGMYFCGKQVSLVVKKSPRKQVPAKIWQIFRYGKITQDNSQ